MTTKTIIGPMRGIYPWGTEPRASNFGIEIFYRASKNGPIRRFTVINQKRFNTELEAKKALQFATCRNPIILQQILHLTKKQKRKDKNDQTKR